MKVVLNVKDDKVALFLEVLRNYSYVKLDRETAKKARILASVKSGLEEVKRAERGEIKLQTAQEWLDGI